MFMLPLKMRIHFLVKVNFAALISCSCLFFSREQQCAPSLSLHDHLVTAGPHALNLHLPTIHKNLCLVGVGTTHIMKLPVSRRLSEIQHLACTCSIGNEIQNARFFLFSIRYIARLYVV